jgi:hypothetical protein
MKLILENGIIHTNPTSSQIEEVLKSIESKENNFLIFERDNDQFMQVALHEETGFYLEYHNGEKEKHFKSINQFNSLEITLKTLVDYGKRNTRWYNIHDWEELSGISQRRTKLISLSTILMILGVLIIVGIVLFKDLIDNTFSLNLSEYYFYLLTFAFGLTLPRFWEDFKDWKNLELLSKTYVISAFVTFFIMFLLSTCTYFGFGNC